MKKTASRLFLLLLCICSLSVNAYALQLIPVGQVIGLELSDNTVTVAAFDEQLGENAKKAGLQLGDTILKIDDSPVCNAEDVRQALIRSKGDVTLQIRRQGKSQTLKMQPSITAQGPKLGIFLKQGITGIGTVTWYDPDTGRFGTLGHGVSGPEGSLLQMVSGKAYPARVASVNKGKAGAPGQLRGAVEGSQALGTLTGNTARGVFGTAGQGWQGQALEVASADQVKTGPATIRSTVAGDTVREYSVEILKIYPKAKTDGRNLLIKVTDPALLEVTGGIVQGMGVSYNRDNPEKPLACRVIWGWSQFCLTLQITAYHAQVCWETIIRCP